MACEHDLSEMDTAAHWDGLCPICLKEDADRMREALEELRVLGIQGTPPEYSRWLSFHDRVKEIAERGLGLNQQ